MKNVKTLIKVCCLIAIAVLTGCGAIKPVAVTPFSDGKHFMLEEPLPYQRPNTTNVVEVPVGFVADFASVPRFLWPVLSPTGSHQWAAFVHDYLYWTQTTTREEADDIFLDAMKESKVSAFKQWAMYRTVRMAGQSAWDANASDRLKGLPRVVPIEYQDIPANTTWPEYRQHLVTKGVGVN